VCSSDGGDHLLGGIAEIFCAGNGKAAVGQQLFALVDVGAFQTHHHRHVHADFLHRRNDAGGDHVAADDAAEDVDQNGFDVGVRGDDLERLRDALGGSAAADVEEVGRRAAVQLDHVHGGHREGAPFTMQAMLPSRVT